MNPKPPGARGELPSALTHLPYQAGPAKLCLVQPAPQLGGPRSLLPSPHPPPLSPHTGCPEDPGGVDGGGQRTGASPSECESRPAGRAGLRWRSSGDSRKEGEMEPSPRCPAPLELFLWAEPGDPEEGHPDRTARDLPPSLHTLVGRLWPLEAYLCRRILQIAHGFVTCGKLHRSSYKPACLSGDWSQEDCRPGVGKSRLAWLPSLPPLTGPHRGGEPFWTWHPGCWAPCQVSRGHPSCHLVPSRLPGAQGT